MSIFLKVMFGGCPPCLHFFSNNSVDITYSPPASLIYFRHVICIQFLNIFEILFWYMFTCVRLVCWSVTHSDFHCVSVFGPLQSLRRPWDVIYFLKAMTLSDFDLQSVFCEFISTSFIMAIINYHIRYHHHHGRGRFGLLTARQCELIEKSLIGSYSSRRLLISKCSSSSSSSPSSSLSSSSTIATFIIIIISKCSLSSPCTNANMWWIINADLTTHCYVHRQASDQTPCLEARYIWQTWKNYFFLSDSMFS